MRFPPARDDASRFGSTSFRERGPQTPRKRMMAQGRKGHFMHDAKAVMLRPGGKMDEQHVRAFLEGVFQRGSRQSTEEARRWLDEKLGDQTLTKDQHAMLARLIEQYSFWR
ncbi:MAG TPA: hypothetical protein VNX21_00450 [Candidatus Thermoplasmatota archaeon]|nr:hypothetical protein [Candidatus Thermoplasmatota archaeon]